MLHLPQSERDDPGLVLVLVPILSRSEQLLLLQVRVCQAGRKRRTLGGSQTERDVDRDDGLMK